MDASGLDNPFWSSLQTRHAALAIRHGDAAACYPAEFAPFLGVASGGSMGEPLRSE